jgi:hypothetical protein
MIDDMDIETGVKIPPIKRLQFEDDARKIKKGESILFPLQSNAIAFRTTMKRMKKITTQRRAEGGTRVWCTDDYSDWVEDASGKLVAPTTAVSALVGTGESE